MIQASQIAKELSNSLKTFQYENCDLSDIGNEIGIIIAKYFTDKQIGFDKEAFIHGLNHGISLTDGTHG